MYKLKICIEKTHQLGVRTLSSCVEPYTSLSFTYSDLEELAHKEAPR